VGEVELQRVVAIEAAEVVARGMRREIFRGRHPEGRARAFDEPPSAAHVVGVVVRDDDVLHGAPGHHAGEVLLPEIECRLDSVTGVHEREAVSVFEDPQVDVVEREGQRRPRIHQMPGATGIASPGCGTRSSCGCVIWS
jgi:hypothetical protein